MTRLLENRLLSVIRVYKVPKLRVRILNVQIDQGHVGLNEL